MGQGSSAHKEAQNAQVALLKPFCVPSGGRETIHERFELQAQATPGALAVSFASERLTYRELNEQANRLAHHLRGLGVGPETCVGVLVERSLELVVTILGVLKAGGCYLPLDPAYPFERLSFMLDDSRAALLLTGDEAIASKFEHLLPVVCLDRKSLETQSAENPSPTAAPENLAYVIYTSGSTGQPKGVAVSHANVARLFDATEVWFKFDERDVWTLFHSAAFDFSVWELWGALLYGGRLVVVPFAISRDPAAFYELLREERVTVLNQTPSAFWQLSQAEEDVAKAELALRLIIFGGEALELQRLKPWFERHGDVRPQLVNMYGITETTVHVTYRPITHQDLNAGSVIGSAIPDLTIHLLDEELRAVPDGVQGEMYVGGAGLARGYLHRPELTAERFVPDPFGGEPGARLYRTGDLARRTRNGDLEYQGRADEQVKIRGFRIEPAEVNAALAQHPAIRESVVLATDDARGEKRLVAYCVANGLVRVTSDDLREFLNHQLPVHMIPSAFVFLENLPLTPNGKVDRKLLPSFDWTEPKIETAFVAPRTNVEQVLAEVWAETLGVQRVGIDDNYFALGGDSILSIRTRAEALDRGFDFSIQQLFEHPTIRQLAELASVAEKHHPQNQQPFDLISEADRRKLPATVQDAYPLSRLQAGMVFHSEFSPDYIIYVSSLRLNLPVDIEKLQATLDQMANRHEMLRTSFALNGFSEPLQLVHQTTHLPLLVEDLRHLSTNDQQRRISEWITTEMRNRFDWTTAPLLRFHLHLLADDEVQFTMSEPFFDGWSVASFFTEFFESYVALLNGESISGEPLLSASYKDFVLLEREALESAECRNYWTTTLAGAAATHLPRRSFTQTDVDAREVMRVEVQVSAEVSDGLKRLAQSIEVPLKSVLLAAHMKVLSLLTAHSDVTTGLLINGRPEKADGERILGAFLNTVPLRIELSAATWAELAQRAYEAENELLPFRRYPIQELQRVHGAQQLFDAVFNYTHFHVADRLHGVEGLELLDVDGTEQTYYPLTAQFNMDLSSRIELALDYRTIELGAEQAREIAGYYSRVLAAMSDDPDARHEAVCLLSDDEQRRLVVELNETAAPFAAEKCVYELFEEQVERAPNAIAVSLGEEELRYRELNLRANKLAWYLEATGVGPEVLVGIFMDRSIEMLVGLLAVLKAGGAYVPLDPEYPPERIRFMIEDSGARVVLTQNALLDRLPQTAAQTICVSTKRTSQEEALAPAVAMKRGQAPLPDLFDSSNSAATQPLLENLQKEQVQSLPENLQKEQVGKRGLPSLSEQRGQSPLPDLFNSSNSAATQPLLENLQKEQLQSLPENLQKEQVGKRGLPSLSEQRGQGPLPDLFNSENLEIRSAPDNVAYVIYTSGSTGRPKGVLVAHRGVTNMIEASLDRFGVNNESRILQGASLSFDASVLEIFIALCGGARLCLMDHGASGDDLAQVLRDRAITTIAITPSSLDTIPDGEYPALQTIIVGGEACSGATAARWSRGRCLFNAYAPTEATVYATTMQYAQADGRIPHLGRPISNMQIYLLDPHLQPVPIGITGEIHVGGVGLARGYLGQPELTAERFIPDPFSAIPGARLYKTGDLARFLADEEIEFIGRVDQQVKLRGFRIELGEIEAVLSQHPGVREAVVIAREDVSGVKRLIAYVVAREGPPTSGEMREYLRKTVPDYMVPSAFVVLESMPLTATGKVDRNALPEPEQARPDMDQIYVAPRTAVEEVLCGIFSEVLQVEPIGIRDNFFELGGHSLLATQISSRVREAFQMELPLRKVFEAPTVERLAEVVLNDPIERERVEQTAELFLKLSTLSDEDAAKLLAER